MKKRLALFVLLIISIIGVMSFVSAECTDSDSGINYYSKGNAIDNNQTVNDECLVDNPKQLSEAYCENEIAKSIKYDCPNGCSNGACLCPTTKCNDGTVYSPEKCSVENNVCICPSCPVTKPIMCSMPTCNGARDTGNKDSNGCSIYECPATTTPVCQPTTCNGVTYECKILNGICSCPACSTNPVSFYISGVEGIKKNYFPSETLNLVIKGVEQDGTPATAEEGFNVQFYIDEWPLVQEQGSKGDNAYYKEGYWYGSIAVPDKLAGYRLQIFLYCSRNDSVCSKKYGIKGAQVENTYYFSIIKGELVQEQVTCVFDGMDKENMQAQKCYNNKNQECSNINVESCAAQVEGYNGEQITWKSSCGSYQYTTQDGIDETIHFNCKSGETTVTEIQNKGFRFAFWQCYDGSESKSEDTTSCKTSETWQKYAAEFCNEKCKEEKCGVNSFSVWNECYWTEIANPVSTTTPSAGGGGGGVAAEPTQTEPILVCKDSCPLDGKCYPFGYRKSGEYCSDQGNFIEQLAGDKACDNNFECSSNVCVSGKCISEGLIQKILSWFKSIFG